MRTPTPRLALVPLLASLTLTVGCGETQGADAPDAPDAAPSADGAQAAPGSKLDEMKSSAEELTDKALAGVEEKRAELQDLLGDKLEALKGQLEKVDLGGTPLPGIGDKVKQYTESLGNLEVDIDSLMAKAKDMAPDEWVQQAEALLAKLKNVEDQIDALMK